IAKRVPSHQLTADPTADGLTIQIDKVDQVGDLGGTDDQGDFLRRVIGAGVLLRRANPKGEWRCLNLATMCVRVPGSAEHLALVDDPFALPIRFQYANDLRQSFLTYVNQPLVSESPWAKFAGRPAPPSNDTTAGIFWYDSPYKPPAPSNG